MTPSSKRAEYVALASLILSVLFFAIAFFLGRYSGYFAVYALSWLILGGVLIWAVLLIQFHTRSLAEQEKLDMSQLSGDSQTPGIFQAKGEKADLFAVAQRRMRIFEKWFLPIFSALIAFYEIAIGLYLIRGIPRPQQVQTKQPLLCAIYMVAIAFVSFLVCRYATGLSRQPKWKPLRAGGSFLLGVVLVSFVLALALPAAHFQYPAAVNILAWAAPILLLVLGFETAINVILDIYRPRFKEQYSRSAFDSRLLGIINEPGEILHTAAGAIDYQFGFKVSQTWFYKLLAKAIVPLILFAAAVVYFLSCIVVVAPNEQAIIERFGDPLDNSGKVRLVEPGITFKLPWPIDIAYKYPTEQIMELYIGFVPRTDPQTGEILREESLLWGKAHYAEEYDWLVASEQTTETLTDEAVPVSLVRAAIPVQYRVKDLYSFLYDHNEPEKLFESICYHEFTKIAASAKVEVDTEIDLRHSLLGAGREQAKKLLTQRIQDQVDQAGLGVEVVFVGLQGIHPPPEVVPAYQQVIGAVQKKQAAILAAEADQNRTLCSLAGSTEDAEKLYKLAAEYREAQLRSNTERVEQLGLELDQVFAQAKGDIFSTLREAQSYRFEKIELACATAERFADQLKAYNAAKDIYKREQRLAVLEEALKDIRKFIIAADEFDTQVPIIDLQEKLTPDLYDIIPQSEEKTEK